MSIEYYCLSCGAIGDLEEYVEEVKCPKCGGRMIQAAKKSGDTFESSPIKETGHPSPQKHIKIAKAVDTGFGGMLATSTDSLSKISPPKKQETIQAPSPSETIKNGLKTKKKTFTISSKAKSVKPQESETTVLPEKSTQKHVGTRLNIHKPPFRKIETKTRIELSKKKVPVATVPLSETKELPQKVKAFAMDTSADLAGLQARLSEERKARLEAEERIKQAKEEAKRIIAEEKAKTAKKASEEAARARRLAEEAALLAAKKTAEKFNAQIAEERREAERKTEERLKKERAELERLHKELEEARKAKADEKFLQETVEKAVKNTAIPKPMDESAEKKDAEEGKSGKELGKEPENKQEKAAPAKINKRTGYLQKKEKKGLPPSPGGEMKKSQSAAGTKTKTAIALSSAAKEKVIEGEKSLEEKISDYGITHTGLLRMQNKKRTIIYTLIFSTLGIIVILILLCMKSCQNLAHHSAGKSNRSAAPKSAMMRETVTRPNKLDYREVAGKVKEMPCQSISQIDEIIKVWKEFIDKYPNSTDNKYIRNAKEQIKTMEDLKTMHTPSK